jgi:hypothetical protein
MGLIALGMAVTGFMAAASPLPAQLVLGQYEDEAPFRTWNTFPFVGAPRLALGETGLACAVDATAALSNPALLLKLSRWTITLNGSFQAADFFRYGPVNTGVISSTANLTGSEIGLDFGAVAYRGERWALSAAAGIQESYGRPPVDLKISNGRDVYYENSFDQSGFLRTVTVSAAHRLGRTIGIGLGLNYAWGSLCRTSMEERAAIGYKTTDEIIQNLSGISFHGGLTWDPSEKLTLALAVRSPTARKARSLSRLRFEASSAATDILIEDSSTDIQRQPWVIGFGAAFRAIDGLTLSADAFYHAWSRYNPDYFGEPLGRNFRDILRLGAGIEYLSSLRLFGRKYGYPLRLGFLYDPQPMKNPHSAYGVVTFGSGIHGKTAHFDLGTALGKETGSGRGLTIRKIALTMSLHF